MPSTFSLANYSLLVTHYRHTSLLIRQDLGCHLVGFSVDSLDSFFSGHQPLQGGKDILVDDVAEKLIAV